MRTSEQPITLVSQSFGRENEYRRVIFSILSFYAVAPKDIPALLFTDRPEYFHAYFEGLPVSYVLLTPEKIKNMRGKIDFLHRMKIALIEEAFTVAGTNLFYADSDTFFTSDPSVYMQAVAENTSFMHLHEYEFEAVRDMPLPGGAAARAFIGFIESQKVLVPGTDVRVNSKMSSWNAGVMVLHHEHRLLLPKVYELTDQFFPATQSHASEQYAFSVVLQALTKLEPCEPVIYHYWYNIKKSIIDEYLATHLQRISGANMDERMRFIKHAIAVMPRLFDNHLLALKDNAIQAFNDSRFGEGMQWSAKALIKGGLSDRQFVKDILYHTKKRFFSSRT